MPKERLWARTAATLFLAAGLLVGPLSIRADYTGRTPVATKPSAATATRPVAGNPAGRLLCAVGAGETLSAIAVRYGVTVGDLVRANGLNNPDNLAVGEYLVVPTTPGVPGNPVAGGTIHSLPWPVSGPVSSPFGEREIFGHREFHTGVDIAAPLGTPIRAPLAGRVVFAGPLGTYGLAVILDHGDGFSTLYAHAEQLQVAPGGTVTAGQTLALVGATGDATGPHVHFETRVDGQPRDPLIYLAGR